MGHENRQLSSICVIFKVKFFLLSVRVGEIMRLYSVKLMRAVYLNPLFASGLKNPFRSFFYSYKL